MMQQISIYFYNIDKIPHNELIFIHTNPLGLVPSRRFTQTLRSLAYIFLLVVIDTLKCQIRI